MHAPVLGDRFEGSNHCKEDSRGRIEKVKEEGKEDEAEKVLLQHGITKHNAAIERCDKYGSA